jgi:hypothetical protein
MPPVSRRLISTSKSLITKFLTTLENDKFISQILPKIQRLDSIPEWKSDHHHEFETIDEQFTKSLLAAEASCAIPVDYAWNPTVNKYSHIYNYWSIKVKGTSNKIDITKTLQQIENSISKDALHQGLQTTKPITQLRHVRRTLINSRFQAQELRDSHLDLRQEELINEGKLDKAHAVRQKQNKERRRRCWKTFKTLRKGNTSTGGLTHVLLRSNDHPPQVKRIQSPQELDPTLLDRNVIHFSQAEGTPFTTKELIAIIGEDGCSHHALDILNGKIPSPLLKYPKLLLSEMRKIRTTIPLDMTLDDMCKGFDKWRENTTTSPS